MRLSHAPAALLLLAAATAGSAAPGTRNFAAAGFDRIAAAGPFTVEVRTGAGPSVRATGEADALDRLEVRVEGGTLKIGTRRDGWAGWARRDEMGRVRVLVTVPSLRAAVLAGSGDLSIDRVRSPSFEAALTGSGDLSVGQLDTARVAATVSGSGDLTMVGRAGDVHATVVGSGDINGQRLSAATASISVVGSGGVALSASRTASVSLTGSGDVTVAGGARCTVSRRGSGSVNCGRS